MKKLIQKIAKKVIPMIPDWRADRGRGLERKDECPKCQGRGWI